MTQIEKHERHLQTHGGFRGSEDGVVSRSTSVTIILSLIDKQYQNTIGFLLETYRNTLIKFGFQQTVVISFQNQSTKYNQQNDIVYSS